jgi:glycosyltransferase involved in cell wall biosynthesis
VSDFKNVTLAVAGKFHAFSLASEFAEMCRLESLYTSYRRLTPPMGLSSSQYKNRLDLLVRTRLPTFTGLSLSLDESSRKFDDWLAKQLKHQAPGILHSWNGSSHKTFRSLQGTGWLRCVERSCPHNQFQYDLLVEEADRLGLKHEQNLETLKFAIEELYLADVIVTPSIYSASTYKDPELIRKVKVNSLGANVEYQPRVSPKSGFNVLMVGNEFLRKGSHYLIEAFKLLDRPDAQLWIRGYVPGEYLARINDPRIKVIPSLSQKKLNELYQSASVFVQPSIDEGFGMTVFEALAFGLPVVVTENVGARDLLTSDVSITVPIRDSEAMSKAIEQAANLPSLAFDEARKALLSKISWQDTAKRMFETVYVD